MLNTAKYIAEQKMKAYEKIHIPTKDVSGNTKCMGRYNNLSN